MGPGNALPGASAAQIRTPPFLARGRRVSTALRSRSGSSAQSSDRPAARPLAGERPPYALDRRGIELAAVAVAEREAIHDIGASGRHPSAVDNDTGSGKGCGEGGEDSRPVLARDGGAVCATGARRCRT